MMPAWAIGAVVFVLGMVIGSFLNVCIVRLPREKKEERSVVRPRSYCPKCKTPIRALDNIPVVSWVLLGGKCRKCKARISALYPAVELATGVMFLGSFLIFGATLEAVKWAVFATLLLVLVVTDVRERILPDVVNFAGMGMGLALSLIVPVGDGSAEWLARKMFEFPPPAMVMSFVNALLGAAAGGGLLWLVGEGYFRLRGREGMGLGDVKMMAMVGMFFGVKRTLLTILVGSLLGSLLGAVFILLWRRGEDYELPFGTFLGAAALVVVVFGTPALEWYQSLFAM